MLFLNDVERGMRFDIGTFYTSPLT
ncbi:protein of unknown function (plasmid) [Cupriavidus taiwanensis]|uniref:Uncharacterized protein n=1 Tax=Cupriavidus taiwanensis TaxID=164546 RepID=A0A9Q7V2T1_9BURK|nr:protein of unknown function [Cupriavidus taiwanensis]